MSNDLADIQPPRSYWEVIQQETKDLRNSDRDAIPFAIEAIRINLACAAFKDETILLEAMQKLEKLKNA